MVGFCTDLVRVKIEGRRRLFLFIVVNNHTNLLLWWWFAARSCFLCSSLVCLILEVVQAWLLPYLCSLYSCVSSDKCILQAYFCSQVQNSQIIF